MTMVAAVSCRAGVAMSADAAAGVKSARPEDGGATIAVTNTLDKVATYGGRFLLGWSGSLDAEMSASTLLEHFAADPAVQSAANVYEFIRAIADAGPKDARAIFLIAWIDSDGLPRIGDLELPGREFRYHDRDPRTQQWRPGLFLLHNDDDKRRFLNEDLIPFEQLPFQSAVDLSRVVIEMTVAAESFEVRCRTVALPLTTAVLTPSGGARMLRGPELVPRNFGLTRAT